jgi:hypothetical protein
MGLFKLPFFVYEPYIIQFDIIIWTFGTKPLCSFIQLIALQNRLVIYRYFQMTVVYLSFWTFILFLNLNTNAQCSIVH